MNSEPPDKHRCIKQSLKNIVRNVDSQRAVHALVTRCHRITVHALQFLKLFLITRYEDGAPLPTVTEHLVLNIMKVICEDGQDDETESKRGKEATKQLK